MSSIEKLSIQGVRSFSPNSIEEIKFQTPLTLIVGTNGSGKTTIIECLKYATTGDMPPISKSNGFLTDPQFYNITTVNAMVKLHFKNLSNKLVITRNSSLSVDPTSATKKSTFKTLTKTLEDYNMITNKKITHEPSKTIAIEDILNKYIGVSKPILDYVIFAHQEDSLWPLSDSNTLKKRFDEIFEVSRFTKELQNLNAVKKNIKVDIKLREGDLINCKDNLKKFHALKDRIQRLNISLDQYDAERIQLEEKLKEIADAQQNLMNINQSYMDIVNEFTQLSNTKENMLRQLHDMSKTYPRIEQRESKENLNTKLKSVNENIARVNENINTKYLNDLKKLNKDLDSCNFKIVSISTKLGGLQQSEKSYFLNKQEMNNLLEQFDYLNTNNKDEIKQIIDKKQFEISQFLKKIKVETDDLKSIINQCETEIAKLSFENKHIDMQTSGLNSELKVLQSKLDLIESDILYRNESEQKSVEEEHTKLIMEINTALKNELSEDAIESKQQKLNAKMVSVKEVDENLESVRKSILSAKQGSEKSNLFHFRKNDLLQTLQNTPIKNFFTVENYDQYENLINSFESYAKNLKLDTFIDIEELCENLENFQMKYSDVLGNQIVIKNKIFSNLEISKRKLELVNLDVNKNNEEIQRNEALMKDLEKSKSQYEDILYDKLDLSLDDQSILQNYEDNLQILKENLNDINESIGMNTGMIQVFEHARKSILKKKCCNICKTSFENDEEKMKLALSYVDKKINTDVDKTNKEKEIAQKEYNIYLKLRGSVVNFCDTRQKIISSKQQYEILLSSQDLLKKQFVELSKLVSDDEEFIQKAEQCIQSLEKCNNALRDISIQSSKLKDTKLELDKSHQEQPQDINSLAAEQDKLSARRTHLGQEITTLTRDISNLKELKVSKEFKKTKYEAEILRSKELFNEANSLKEQLSNKKQILNKNQETLKQNQKKIKESKNNCSEYKLKLNEFEIKNGKEIKNKEEELNSLKNKTSRLFDYLLPEMKKFEDEEQHELLSNTTKLSDYKEQSSAIKNSIHQTSLLIEKGRKELEIFKEETKVINQVLQYLSLKDEYILVCDKLSNINEQEVLEYQKEYSSTAQELNMAFTDISSEISSKKGEIRQIKNQIETDLKTIDHDYADIENKYHEINCNSKTLLNMEHDLDIAGKVIEMSIMNFHSKRMEEINVLLDELWRTTYKGSDIATIKIVTEKVKKNSTASGSNIDSYNYKVVMYKDSLEIDMRGRCSAGQKVMACILIRLALAETFGVSCGVITLDEPTTNLDQENSEGLAESLHRIIESRRFQQNFQIVIITHDENFLKFMNAQDFTDGFWKVSKDNNLASKIEWKSIENLIQ